MLGDLADFGGYSRVWYCSCYSCKYNGSTWIWPCFAAIICLIANTTPTAFGGIGIPVTTLAKVTNIDVIQLSYAVGLQLSVLIVIIPIVLVMLTGKVWNLLRVSLE